MDNCFYCQESPWLRDAAPHSHHLLLNAEYAIRGAEYGSLLNTLITRTETLEGGTSHQTIMQRLGQ